ncbi:MAG: type I-E CRISPR-associated protein Cse2/CasB [Roseovarius sp.]|uniref:type I-E CRISPR-associated protein Cse2/CasB n=1 Tax=Roseovarius sp. TaxID=1486281 RepID=UPI004058CFEB
MSDTGKKILSWWRKALDRKTPRGRALSARLRRASPLEVLCEPEVHELAEQLETRNAARLFRVVTVLAEVRENSGTPLARVLGGSDPVLSHLRFQRLMRSSDDELVSGLRRAIRMTDHPCNVAALGEDLMFWNEDRRTRWCFQYFGADAPKQISRENVE